MPYLKLVLALNDDYHEAMIAELAEMDFEGFEEQDGFLIAYIDQVNMSDVNREHIEMLLSSYPGNGYVESEQVLDDQNWNESWEATIQPQNIGKFFVRPTWSDEQPAADSILLEIDPKMSFGTGYHETTRLMLRFLPKVIKGGEEVLDAGTGTGILCIASLKLGANYAFGYDIDEWSYQNALENAYINSVADNMEIRRGSFDVIPTDKLFDVIVANINRNIIEEQLPEWTPFLKDDGQLVLSGLLATDQDSIVAQAKRLGLQLRQKKRENEWVALHFSFTKGM